MLTEAGTPVLELRDLYKRFGQVEAVRGVTETLRAGEYFCILGPSGCGKTTLLRLIAGFETPSGGDILLMGRSVRGLPPERRDVNVVFQNYALFPHMTVSQNVAFGLEMKRLPRTEVQSRVGEVLELVGLSAEAGRYPRQLSGGQQQRVALARAIVNRPRVLLLDEPLSALDRNLRLAMQQELRRLQRETGVTFLHITHDQGEALSLADRLAVMRAGRFVQVGRPRDVYLRPGDRFVAEFVGGANVLDAELDVSEPDVAHVAHGFSLQLDGDGRRAADLYPTTSWSLPGEAAGGVRVASGVGVGERRAVALSLRPEAIRVLDPEQAGRVNTWTGTLRQVSFVGAAVECVVDIAGVHLRVHVPAGARVIGGAWLAEGRDVAVHVPPSDIVVLPR